MKLNRTLLSICDTYRRIIQKDGSVEKEELLKMLKQDEYIPTEYQNDSYYDEMIKCIQAKSDSKIKEERRLKLFQQGLSKEEIATKEGVHVSSIIYLLKKHGLYEAKKEPAVTGECKKCKYYFYYIEHNEKNQGGKQRGKNK